MIPIPAYIQVSLRRKRIFRIMTGMTSATPLAQLRAGETVDLASLVIGRIPGTIGEVSVIALLIGAIYMVVRKVISPVIPVTYLATAAALSALLGRDPLMDILSGGLLLGAIFMATDYTTSPINFSARVIYAVGCGVLTFLFRYFGSYVEGVSYAIVADNGVGVVIEVNSQTDFVAKNEVFQAFVKDLALVVANENPADVEALKACTYPGTDRTVSDVTADKVLAIGENIQIRRFVRYAEGVNVPYIHMGGKIGVLVNMEVEGIDATQVTELGKDVAMQIAAMNPAYLDKSEVDQATLDKEKEIQLAQMANDPKMAAKPEKVKQGIVMGKLGKYFEENCLLQQAFVKENKTSVEKHVAEVAKQLGGKITIKAFTRFATGEGIEKKEDDFAAEVASMIK